MEYKKQERIVFIFHIFNKMDGVDPEYFRKYLEISQIDLSRDIADVNVCIIRLGISCDLGYNKIKYLNGRYYKK